MADANGSDPLVVLLPGLGADHRLFNLQREAFPDICIPSWLPPKAARTPGGLRGSNGRADRGDKATDPGRLFVRWNGRFRDGT